MPFASVNFDSAPPHYVSGCWDGPAGSCCYGLVDSTFTATVHVGDLCVLPPLSTSCLHETEGAYVAPSVGVIPASASLRDSNLQRQALEEIFCSV